MAPSQPLPAKENALFKKIIKCYEQKQYKNGLKLAKQILSNVKYAEHGETLAMKGLTLNCLGKKDEAYEYVRRGLRNDLKSHVCWHVYGLLQRSDHKYDEAIKCYRNALKWDKDNIQILRDLSMLQIHMRDLEGYKETRYQLLMLRPTTEVSWIGYAMAHHLLKDYDTALDILDEYKQQQQSSAKSAPPPASARSQRTSAATPAAGSGATDHKPGVPAEPVDPNKLKRSELLLYHATVYKEAGKIQEALDFLKRSESDICDKLAVHEMKTELLLARGRNGEAVRLIRDHLISRNPENMQYYKWLESAENWNDRDENWRRKLYTDLQVRYPKAQMPFRLPLNFVQDQKVFQDLIETYITKSLCKGQPALFRDLKSLYIDLFGPSRSKRNQELESRGEPASTENGDASAHLHFKLLFIERLMLQLHHNLQTNSSFSTDTSTRGSEDPTRILWVKYYLAQHFDYIGRYDMAVQFVDESLAHTPTLIEFHVLKAKILKHWDKMDDAVRCMEEAQSLDTADRYLNSKCAKYLLRANKITESEEMCAKFTRDGVSAAENLNEMQCMWFQTEAALAYQRIGKYGDALKKCIEVDRHFAEITEDQFDFHIYCMRKMTLKAYVALLRLEDILKSHPFYFRAAKIAIEVYLKLYDNPLGEDEMIGNVNTANMTPSEIKKLRNKDRKEKLKKEKQEIQEKQMNNANSNHTEKNNTDSVGSDPVLEPLDAAKLQRPDDPLSEALKFLRPLQLLARDRRDTHFLSFEIHYRRNKVMLMLQSLKRALKLNADSHPVFQRQLRLFHQKIEEQKEQLSQPVIEVLHSELIKFSSVPLLGERMTSMKIA
jgi:peptide alpha-N-acetyltransferase